MDARPMRPRVGALRGEMPTLVTGNAYVQHSLDASRFTAVPARRLQARNVESSSHHNAVGLPPSWHACMLAHVLDPEAGLGERDECLLALALCTESSRAAASTAFFVCQGLLAGLSFACLVAPLEEVAEQLPGLGRLSVVLAEVALVGSLLQLSQARERLLAAEEAWLRRRLVTQSISGALLSVANSGSLFCSLLSARGAVAHAHTARSLLLWRALFGLVALACALVGAQDRLSPRWSWVVHAEHALEAAESSELSSL